MSVTIDMEMQESCYECPLCNGERCILHETGYRSWPDEYAHCPLHPAPERERWIPVAERLPEDGVYVLAYCADDDYMCVEAKHKFAVFQITHWMPLPKPPKEEDECP